jgi:hypothetical protein
MSDLAQPQTLANLISPSPRFQRAVHLRYDLRDTETIDRYIPTISAVNAIEAILRGTNPHATQRAHVLHAAYGSGKSLLAVALAALLENPLELAEPVERLLKRIHDVDPEVGGLADTHLNSNRNLLPVVLSGDEGDITTALTRTLTRALKDIGLGALQPQTRFSAAIQTIEKWEQSYPDTYKAFVKAIRTRKYNLKNLIRRLEDSDVDAYILFEQLYTQLTAGVEFDHFSQYPPELVYQDVAAMLPASGYSGIVVLWDEFGRYLESRATQAFSGEAALLQKFAEACNYSGEHQLHLLLFAHKELQGYATSLPKPYQQEWSRIEGRFQRHNISGDPYVAYRLIANSIQHTDVKIVEQLLIDAGLDSLVQQTWDFRLFSVFDIHDIRDILHRTWPLHPLTLFALTRLSNKVAQNERTMFTFLTVDEPHSLYDLLRRKRFGDDECLIRSDALWDYFSDAIRADTGVGGAHRVWSGVAHALDKIFAGDVLGEALIKTLGVITICADSATVRPTTELLSWAVDAGTDEQKDAVKATLENLRRRKVIIHRQADGYWTFTSGSDIDFEQKLSEALERTNPTSLQLRRLLEQVQPAPYTLARRYNQDRAITRYFTGLYRWASEIQDAPWDIQIRQLDRADGLVVYILATDELSLREAWQALQPHEQVIYVLPEKPLVALGDVLRELFGLHELNNDPELKQQDDRERIQRELDWLLEDVQSRLERELGALIEPRSGKAFWMIAKGAEFNKTRVVGSGQATRLVSEICERVFSATPIFNSEGLNRRYPTGQQIGAAQKVIDALFANTLDATLGLEGHGPEIAALNSLLVMTGILRQTPNGAWIIHRPEGNALLAEVWAHINRFLDICQTQGKQPVSVLFEALIAAPFGIRQGVLPILLAAVMRSRIKATTIRRDDRAIHPINGKLLTDLVMESEHYTIEIGEWSELQENLWQALFSRFSSHIHESERSQQPLTILKVSMLRWLQGLPAFCRDTQQLSPEAIKLRNLIRVAQTDPAKVLFQDLPELLKLDQNTSQETIEAKLDGFLAEISNAYLDLQRRLDAFAIREFGHFSDGRTSRGSSALQGWASSLHGNQNGSIREMRFGSLIAQQVVETVVGVDESDNHFWDRLSLAATGVHLRDWNDQSETKFYQTLQNTRIEIEREAEELLRGETVVSVSLQLPKAGQKEFRFRASDLTAQGRRILQNFKSTLEISGRPLSVDEKRQIVIAFLCHVMGEDIDE